VIDTESKLVSLLALIFLATAAAYWLIYLFEGRGPK
jgi:uncharacterized protein with PQ loop repeat